MGVTVHRERQFLALLIPFVDDELILDCELKFQENLYLLVKPWLGMDIFFDNAE